jgi:hypothetical protein
MSLITWVSSRLRSSELESPNLCGNCLKVIDSFQANKPGRLHQALGEHSFRESLAGTCQLCEFIQHCHLVFKAGPGNDRFKYYSGTTTLWNFPVFLSLSNEAVGTAQNLDLPVAPAGLPFGYLVHELSKVNEELNGTGKRQGSPPFQDLLSIAALTRSKTGLKLVLKTTNSVASTLLHPFLDYA